MGDLDRPFRKMEEVFNERVGPLVPNRKSYEYGSADMVLRFCYLQKAGFIRSFIWHKVEKEVNWIKFLKTHVNIAKRNYGITIN